ncbi:MAG: hypothetical protein ACI9JM_003381 [Halioglobus sp.]|jgi:hypothetical protein
MQAFELSSAIIEARDVAADHSSMGERIEAYRSREPASDLPLIVSDPSTTSSQVAPCIPEIKPEEFNAGILQTALAKHGALIVRQMFSQESLAGLVHAADRVIDECEDPLAEHPHPGTYFNPPENLRSIMPKGHKELGNTRTFHRDSGSSMCVEAPCVAESLLALYEAYGLKEILGEYLQEAPCLTAKKWVLRRSKLPVAEAGWHQDGAFMGTDINSINMWLPLNECGGETGAPGMDLLPQRLHEVTSAEGAQFDWSVSDSHIDNTFKGARPIAPEFNSGDALFFDHFFLHRTQYRTDFSQIRYAVETWFFGQSRFPKNQIPLAW